MNRIIVKIQKPENVKKPDQKETLIFRKIFLRWIKGF